ncbi:hypothetical protein [Fretibacter rubidus]|uniref:hypothetical protein n=1 Tax=Fretibacter rubidus TaxID=570162 RepID=UPI00352B3B84
MTGYSNARRLADRGAISLEGLSNQTGLYKIWKTEKSVWLDGQDVMRSHVMDDAIIVPPTPLPPQRFKTLIENIGSARPFETVEFSEQEFLNLGNTIIISYNATANHQRFRRPYLAHCITTYVMCSGRWQIASHSHVKRDKRG